MQQQQMHKNQRIFNKYKIDIKWKIYYKNENYDLKYERKQQQLK